ncbi:MAG: protoheme IX farnesyltransferase [Bryobacteraceae bacterium]|nr:protoheme IX farnesyltransferase [Bryobacteraceae bacterium]
MNDYLQLTKPRITWLILMSTGVGFFFGLPGRVDWLLLLHTIVGTGLIASGTAALNQWMERDEDSKMNRTRHRPLPAGRLIPANAFWFAVGLSVLGFAELWLGANLLTALLGFFTLATYLFVYTPLKRITHHSTTLGAIPGAMPPVIGFAAARGELTVEALALFAILFLWQFPHFYAIAWMYRDDYGRAGIRMLPVIDPTGERTVRQILLTALCLLPVSLAPSWLGMAGNWYAAGALLLGTMYVWYSILIFRERTLLRARAVLLASIAYLPMLYILLLADRTRSL